MKTIMRLYKYQGAGNDFLIADNRSGAISLDTDEISRLCDRHYGIGADGLMLLEKSIRHDFRMVYFNSDGSGGMMCGNGGRCIVAFAASDERILLVVLLVELRRVRFLHLHRPVHDVHVL